MIKALLTILVKLVEAKLEKAGVETLILKNENYINVAKQIWYMIDENFRISTTVEEKLKSKVDFFNEAILKKFPELNQKDIDDLRQAIAGEVNQGKAAVLENSAIINQLQTDKANLKAELETVREQLNKVQALVATTPKAEDSVSAVNS
ncbi:hypothetical protein [Clostridium saccharoperbutylacetonicum]|uniref:hypothetical protein n=1 Tax=Clostridium saccharoperbutylacetonicum TaxID=36745 RepID=UPI0039E9B6BA